MDSQSGAMGSVIIPDLRGITSALGGDKEAEEEEEANASLELKEHIPSLWLPSPPSGSSSKAELWLWLVLALVQQWRSPCELPSPPVATSGRSSSLNVIISRWLD